MTAAAGMKVAALASLLIAAALFVAMSVMQQSYGLQAFQFGRYGPRYSAEDVSRAVKAEPAKAAFVVFPYLFPIDLLFLAFAAAGLALTAIVYAPAGLWVPWPWLLVLPGLYLVSDFTENALLAGMLSGLAPVSEGVVAATHLMTHLKWGSFCAAGAQAVVAFGISFVR
jgi:hypothetical protein